MKIRFQITVDEFEEAVRAVRRWHYRLLAAGAVMLGALTAGYAGYNLFREPRNPLAYVVLAAGGFTVFMLTAGQSRLIRRIWHSRPALREPQTVEMTPVGIRLAAGAGEKTVPWADVAEFRETPCLFIISCRDGALRMVPKRTLGGGPGVEKFRAVLGSKVAGSSTGKSPGGGAGEIWNRWWRRFR